MDQLIASKWLFINRCCSFFSHGCVSGWMMSSVVELDFSSKLLVCNDVPWRATSYIGSSCRMMSELDRRNADEIGAACGIPKIPGSQLLHRQCRSAYGRLNCQHWRPLPICVCLSNSSLRAASHQYNWCVAVRMHDCPCALRMYVE